MGLAAAEVGLQLHDRVAAPAGQPLRGAGQQPAQAFGQVGAAEKLHRVAVLGGSLANVDLPQVGGELGLLVTSAGDVMVWGHHLPPRLEPRRRNAGGRAAHDAAPLAAHLFLKAQPQQLLLQTVELLRLRRRHRGQEALRGVEGAVGVVGGERRLVRPPVAVVAQLAHQAAVGASQNRAEHLVPGLPHHLQQQRGVPFGGAPPQRRIVGVLPEQSGVQVARLHRPLDLALDERPQSGAQQVQPLADPFVIGHCHSVSINRRMASRAGASAPPIRPAG